MPDFTFSDKPTKDHLLKVVMHLLENISLEEITSDLVLHESHVSKGSLYHHFEDFQDLVEDAQILLYSQHVETTLENLIGFVRNNPDPEKVRNAFKDLIRAPNTIRSTFFREQKFAISFAGSRSPRMRRKLAPVQEVLTQKWIQIAEICHERQWVNPELDSRAISILLQSTVMGKILDDNSLEHVDLDEWMKALDYIFDVVFFGNLEQPESSPLAAVSPKSENEIKEYSLEINKEVDTSSYVKNFIDSIYKMYKIEMITSDHADEALQLYLKNSDNPNFADVIEKDIPFSSVPNIWESNQTVYGAFYDNKLIGFVNCRTRATEAEVDKCIVDRNHRGNGIATALVSFLILSKLNKGVSRFVSHEDQLVPARLKIMTQLGFKPTN
jgi:AcrR family transcriptional regulator/GNAT superfamily N-acetyltransferase